MAIELPALPYSKDALAPHISEETLEFHYGKHHSAYVTNANKLIIGTPFEHQPLEEIVRRSEGGLYNNAAQVWNHTFYWNSLSPRGGGEPKGEIARRITEQYSSFAQFKEQFTQLAMTVFGSGWCFLVVDTDGKLAITQEPAAGCPLRKGQKGLLTCDVWEHAYYIDYRNLRAKYIEAFWQLVNWDFAEANLKGS